MKYKHLTNEQLEAEILEAEDTQRRIEEATTPVYKAAGPRSIGAPPKNMSELANTESRPFESFGRGYVNGGTFGFAPKIIGALGAPAVIGLRPDLFGNQPDELRKDWKDDRTDQSYEDVYEALRDTARQQDREVANSNPYMHFAGSIAGSVAPLSIATKGLRKKGIADVTDKYLPALGTMKRSAISGAGWGALQGLGESDAGEVGELGYNNFLDMAKSATGGAILGGGLQGLYNKFWPGLSTVGNAALEKIGLYKKYGIPFRRSQITGDAKDTAKEAAQLHGKYGAGNEAALRANIQEQEKALQDAAAKARNDIGGEEFIEKGAHIGPQLTKVQQRALESRKKAGLSEADKSKNYNEHKIVEEGKRQKAAKVNANEVQHKIEFENSKIGNTAKAARNKVGDRVYQGKGVHLTSAVKKIQKAAKSARIAYKKVYDKATENIVSFLPEDFQDFPGKAAKALQKLTLGKRDSVPKAYNRLDEFVHLITEQPDPYDLNPAVSNVKGSIIKQGRETIKNMSQDTASKNISVDEKRLRTKTPWKTITNIKSEKHVSHNLKPVTLNELEEWKKGTNKALRSAKKAGDGAEVAALQEVLQVYNQFKNEVIERTLVSKGDKAAVANFRKADDLVRAYKQKYETTDKNAHGKKYIQDSIVNPSKGRPSEVMTNELHHQNLFGKGKLGSDPKTAMKILELKNHLSDKEFNQVKAEAAADLLEPLLRESPNITQYSKDFIYLMKEAPSLAKALFTKPELRLLNSLRKAPAVKSAAQKATQNKEVSEWFDQYSPKHVSETGKKFLNDLIDRGLNSKEIPANEELATAMFGSGKYGFAPNTLSKVREVKKKMTPEEFKSVKLEAAHRIVSPLLEKGGSDLKTYNANLDKFLQETPTLAKELFTPEEIAIFHDLGKLGSDILMQSKNRANAYNNSFVISAMKWAAKTNPITGWFHDAIGKIPLHPQDVEKSLHTRGPKEMPEKGKIATTVAQNSTISALSSNKDKNKPRTTPAFTSPPREKEKYSELSDEELEMQIKEGEAQIKSQEEAGSKDKLLDKIATAESDNDPNARNPDSTAKGMYQFTKPTWKGAVNKYGAKTGITLADWNDPQAQRRMAKIMLDEAEPVITELLGRKPNETELYATHFLGLGDAQKLLGSRDYNQPAARLLPAAAKDNRAVFFDGRRPRSVVELLQELKRRLNRKSSSV